MRDTELYDEDTDTYYADANTYCRHGNYIGTPGGPDILCGACEDDDDPSPAELRKQIEYLCHLIEASADFYESICIATPQALRREWIGGFYGTWVQYAHRADFAWLRALRSSLAMAERYATGPDDNTWLRTAHWAQLRGETA